MTYKGSFKLNRMLPQGKFHYFFSFENECFVDLIRPAVNIGTNEQRKILKKLKMQNKVADLQIDDFVIDHLNYRNTI